MKAPLKLASVLSSVALLFIAGVSASAQLVSIYGTFAPLHVSNVPTGNTTGLNFAYTTGSFWTEGVGGGFTLTPFHIGPVSLGLDLRGSTSRQKQGADLLLAGIKVGGKLPLIPLKPYAQASSGYLGARATITNAPSPIAETNPNRGFWVYELLGGVDYTLLPHLDLRLIEIGGGQGYYKSGPDLNSPGISFLTVNTGVVVHF